MCGPDATASAGVRGIDLSGKNVQIAVGTFRSACSEIKTVPVQPHATLQATWYAHMKRRTLTLVQLELAVAVGDQ
jgi:hypothetical protein